MQQGIRKLQRFEYLKVVFLEILNALLCRVFANQVTFCMCMHLCTVRDNTFMLVLQLATILHMVPEWKSHMKVRVFMIVSEYRQWNCIYCIGKSFLKSTKNNYFGNAVNN